MVARFGVVAALLLGLLVVVLAFALPRLSSGSTTGGAPLTQDSQTAKISSTSQCLAALRGGVAVQIDGRLAQRIDAKTACDWATQPEKTAGAMQQWLGKAQAPQVLNGKRQIDSEGHLVRLLSDPVDGVAIADVASATKELRAKIARAVSKAPTSATLATKGKERSTEKSASPTTPTQTPAKTEVTTSNREPSATTENAARTSTGETQAQATELEPALVVDFAGKTVAATWEDTIVAPVALAYDAPEGEAWIDVNLSNSTIAAMVGKQIVLGPFPMISGHPAAPTIRGSFAIYYKTPQQVMRGVGWDGPYEENAPWIMYFQGDYGIHGAPWRRTFVADPQGGSHGCINMDSADAKQLFDWAGYGTKVVVH